jgi:tetratricopeptide (TPR) repeat protein
MFFLFQVNIKAQNINVEKVIDSILLIRDHDIEKTMRYTDSILQYDFSGKEKIVIEKGLLYLLSNKPKKALAIFDRLILNLINNEKQLEVLGNAYVGAAQACNLLGNTDKALNYMFKGLAIGEKLNDPSFEVSAFSVISIIYYKAKDYENAIVYAKKSLAIELKNKGDKLNEDFLYDISGTYNNLAVFYGSLKKLDSSIYYNKKALTIYKELDKKLSIAISYNNIASVYKTQKKYNQAIGYFKKSIQIHQETKSNSTSPLFNIAITYLDLGKYKLAKKNYLKALSIAKATNDIKKQEKIYAELFKLAIKQKDYKNSLDYQQKQDSLIQKIITNTNNDKLQLISTQFEQRKKENQLKQELALNKKNTIIIYTISGLLLFVGLFFLQKYRNRQLKLKQEKLVLEQKVLRSQMNPHFIFNALTSIQKNLLEEDLLKSSTSLARFAKLIRQNFEFTNKPLINLDEDLEALKNYIETQQLRFEDKFNYEINVQKGLDLSYIQIPPMLLQPFVENAIEHGFKSKEEKGNLIINVLKKDDLFLFEIIDDGIGFKEKISKTKREHAIDIFLNRLKLRGFSEEKSFKITSAVSGKGTKILFTLKL